MKSIITSRPKEMPVVEFQSAMIAMRYLIALVEKAQKLPYPNAQYVEWTITGFHDEGQWHAIGRPTHLHDTRYADSARRIKCFSASTYGDTVEASTDQIHRIRYARVIDIFYFYSDMSTNELVDMFVQQIESLARS